MRLSDASLAGLEFSFDIPSTIIIGPLNLKETILSGQTSGPQWLKEGAFFTNVERFKGTRIKYTLSQQGQVDGFTLRVHALSSRRDEQVADELRSHLIHVLGLRDNLSIFYETFADETEPLASTFRNLRGLRLMRATNLYESLICSILSQNSSLQLWNRMARLLMRHYGSKVDFPDGSFSFLFPRPEALAKLTPRELRSSTSMGYRATPVVEVSRLIVKGQLQLDEFAQCPYEEAIEILLDLPGVGPKVADCFLLYGVGRLEAAPVDVWIHRIVSRLYFKGRKVSRLKTARFLRERFREWAGYAQLYLFDYARRTNFDREIGTGPQRSGSTHRA